jgi:hypothetical protein
MDITRKGREDLEDYKNTIEEARQLQEDQMGAEMFIAWKENNPNEFKEWQENGSPLDGNDKPIIKRGKI